MSAPPRPEFSYVRLGAFAYNVVRDASAATDLLRCWLSREWQADHAEAPAEAEREQSVLRGVSIEPLVVFEPAGELMDGYTRYWLLREHGEPQVYAYLASKAE